MDKRKEFENLRQIQKKFQDAFISSVKPIIACSLTENRLQAILKFNNLYYRLLAVVSVIMEVIN